MSTLIFLLLIPTCRSHVRTGSRKGSGIKTCVQILALPLTGNELLVMSLHLSLHPSGSPKETT